MAKILGGKIEYEILIEYDGELFVVGNARFLENFRPWGKGERAEKLRINFEACIIEEFVGEQVIRRGKFSFYSIE